MYRFAMSVILDVEDQSVMNAAQLALARLKARTKRVDNQ
jgi:hypothetical protein